MTARRSLLLPFLLLGALLLAPPGLLGQPAGYYRSDSIGLALEPLPGFSAREDYLLRVQREGDLETRTLYRSGRELRRWERTPSREKVFEKGVLSEEREYDPAGRLLVDRELDGGKLRQVSQYRYGASGLAAVETYDGEGRLLARERYELGPCGELRRVRQEAPGSSTQEAALIGPSGRLYEERLLGGGRLLVNRYGPDGLLVSQEIRQGRELLETLAFTYSGSVPLSSERTAAGARTLTQYDAAGREASRRVSRNGETVEEWSFRYDSDGNRVQANRLAELGPEQWSYAYGPGGVLQREEYRVRGRLQKVVRYQEEGSKVEELYRSGEPFLVVTWRDGVKVLEEFIEGGQVVRRREPEPGP
jgi:hypothetical protein